MKKSILAALVLLSSLTASAQLPSLNFGLKGGINISELKTDWAESENRLGYQAGIWARVGAAGLYVQPEAYLGSKGGEFTSDDATAASFKAKVNFTTLDVPVLIGYKFGLSKLNVHFMTGPVVSFMLNKDTNSNYDEVKDYNNYKNQTIGAQAGAGVDVGNITLDLRYEKGLSNISKSGQYDQKQNLWHISLGYKLF